MVLNKFAFLFFAIILVIAADWPQFRGPNRDGISDERLVPWPATGPKVLWKKEVGPGWATPVIADGKLFLFHRVTGRTSDDEVLACLDAATGNEIWTAKYPTAYRDQFGFEDGPRATPLALPKENLVVTFGADGELTGWEFATGKQLWQRHVIKDYRVKRAFFGTGTSPLFADGKILLNVGAKGASVVAFDPKTGKELWKAGDDEVSYSSPVMAKIDDAEAAVFFTRDGLLVLSPRDGAIKYQHPWRPRNPNSVNAAAPVVSGNRVFLSTSYGQGGVLLELSKGNIAEIWKGDDILSAHYNSPVLRDGHLFGIEGRQEYGAKLRCIDFATGKVKWTKDGFGCADLLLAGKSIVALTEKGELVLFEADPASYKELTRAKILDGTCRAGIALAGGRLYARDSKTLVCVDVSAK